MLKPGGGGGMSGAEKTSIVIDLIMNAGRFEEGAIKVENATDLIIRALKEQNEILKKQVAALLAVNNTLTQQVTKLLEAAQASAGFTKATGVAAIRVAELNAILGTNNIALGQFTKDNLALANSFSKTQSAKAKEIAQLEALNKLHRTSYSSLDQFTGAQKKSSRLYQEATANMSPLIKSVYDYERSVKSFLGSYDKASGEFRGTTSGMRRSIGALRNNLLLVAFAFGGVIAAIQQFVESSNRLQAAFIGVGELANAMGVSMKGARELAVDLAKTGLVPLTAAAGSVKSILATGLGLEETRKLLFSMLDVAAFNRQGMLSIGEALERATQGYKNFMCLSGDTEILDMADGNWYTLKDMHDNNKRVPCVLSVDRKTKKVKVIQASYLHYNGYRAVYEIQLENGRTIKATDNHRFLTKDGFKFVADLSEGEILFDVDEKLIKEQLSEYMEWEEDSIENNKNLVVAKETKEAISLAQKLGINSKNAEKYLNILESISPKELENIVVINGIQGTIEENSVAKIALVILEDLKAQADGTESNIKEFHILSKEKDYTEENKDLQSLPEMPFDVYDAVTLLAEIFMHIMYSDCQNGEGLDSTLSMESPYVKCATDGYIQRLNKVIENQLSITPMPVKIVRISYAGMKDVYDLSVPESYNFVANNIVTHNSQLTDNVGITKNLSEMQKEYAKSIGTTMNKLTEQQKYYAQYIGFLKEGEKFEGNRLKLMETLGGKISMISALWTETVGIMGQLLHPAISMLIGDLLKLTNVLRDLGGGNTAKMKADLMGLFDDLKEMGTIAATPFIALYEILNGVTEKVGNARFILNTFATSMVTMSISTWAVVKVMNILIGVLTTFKGGMGPYAAIIAAISIGYQLYNKEYKDRISLIREQTEAQREVMVNRELELRDTYAMLKLGILEREEKDKLIKKWRNLANAIAGTRKQLVQFYTDQAALDYIKSIREELAKFQSLSQHIKGLGYADLSLTSDKTKQIKEAMKIASEAQAQLATGGPLTPEFLKNIAWAIAKLSTLSLVTGTTSVNFGKMQETIQILTGMLGKGEKEVSVFDRKLGDLIETVKEAGEAIKKLTLSELAGMLPSFEDLGNSVLGEAGDLLFKIKQADIDAKVKELAKRLSEALGSDIPTELLSKMKLITKIFEDSLRNELNTSFKNAIDKVTITAKEEIEEFYKDLGKMGGEQRKINFLTQFIGGDVGAKLETTAGLKVFDDMEAKITRLGPIWEEEFNMKIEDAVKALQEMRAIFEGTGLKKGIDDNTKKMIDLAEATVLATEKYRQLYESRKTPADFERTAKVDIIDDAINREQQAAKKSLILNNEDLYTKQKNYEMTATLADMELELLRQKGYQSASTYSLIAGAHEQAYTMMSEVTEAFFDKERRQYLTMEKVGKYFLKSMLGYMLSVFSEEARARAKMAAAYAMTATGQALLGDPTKWAAAGKFTAAAIAWGALGGVLGGMATSARGAASAELNKTSAIESASGGTRTGGSVSGGTKAGAVTEAMAANITISPSVVINGNNVILGEFGSVEEAANAIGRAMSNSVKQSIETGEIDLTNVRRR